MTSAYEAQLAADRHATQYGTVSHRANPPEYHGAPEPAQFSLKPPTAAAITHPPGATAAQRAWADCAHAAAKFEEYLESIAPAADNDPRYTESGIRETIRSFADTQAMKAVERSLDVVRANVAATEVLAQQARERLVQTGDTAAELRATRYWARTERSLDIAAENSGKLTARVDSLVRDAGSEELSVLLQELPSYLESKGLKADFLDDMVAEAAPAYGYARRAAVAAQQTVQLTEHNVRFVKARITNAYPPARGFTPPKPVGLIPFSPDYDPELVK